MRLGKGGKIRLLLAATGERRFLPAAKPTGQGTESVVLLVVVGVTTFISLMMFTQMGCEKKKLCQKIGVKRKTFLTKK